eukprot:TRINITY_DN194_c0_g1_i2.p4 TRINITY_DN194_c0_g1~~TRINITY_DN194_c0_g1_i2.p4  ORF type:complete len:213 (+),score=57.54 TRINITY_DN194_c0_g1_i2:488-1126(+)
MVEGLGWELVLVLQDSGTEGGMARKIALAGWGLGKANLGTGSAPGGSLDLDKEQALVDLDMESLGKELVPADLLSLGSVDSGKGTAPAEPLGDLDKERVPASALEPAPAADFCSEDSGKELFLACLWSLGKELVPADLSDSGREDLGTATVLADSGKVPALADFLELGTGGEGLGKELLPADCLNSGTVVGLGKEPALADLSDLGRVVVGRG